LNAGEKIIDGKIGQVFIGWSTDYGIGVYITTKTFKVHNLVIQVQFSSGFVYNSIPYVATSSGSYSWMKI
jgi:hypothetical protein